MRKFIYYACGSVYAHRRVLSDTHTLSKLELSMIHTQDHVEFRMMGLGKQTLRVSLFFVPEWHFSMKIMATTDLHRRP
jgi:hypothetical protein